MTGGPGAENAGRARVEHSFCSGQWSVARERAELMFGFFNSAHLRGVRVPFSHWRVQSVLPLCMCLF